MTGIITHKRWLRSEYNGSACEAQSSARLWVDWRWTYLAFFTVVASMKS